MDPYNNLRSFGEALIDGVDPARAEVVAARALAAPSVGLPFRRRLVAIAAASATFITGNLGVAMAADSAVPGDLLYGLDRAYEQLSELVGLGNDHTAERLDEAAQLAASGDTADALDVVIEQLQGLSGAEQGETPDVGSAVVAVEEARDRALEAPTNETTAEASAGAKEIVGLAHGIADAMQNGRRDLARELIEELKAAARANGNGSGRGQNNGNGPPDEPGSRGNGGDRGNSGQAPGQQP